MRILSLMAASAVALSAPAFAQDTMPPQDTASAPGPQAPDGTPAFGIEPYFGVMGGYETFDSQDRERFPQRANGNNLDGGLVQGVAGINLPLGPVFVGAEGNVIKGFKGDIDWEYGAAGRFGFRAGDSGLFYGKVGYQWVNFDKSTGIGNRDYGKITYGIGAEIGPKSIGLGGLTGNSGVRFRVEANTYGDAKSFRPMAGVIAHF